MPLNTRQRVFVNEYLKSFNATQAAIAAGYSEKTARSIGSENLTKPDIVAELERIYRENTMTADEVLFHLTQIARGDFSDLTDRFGDLDLEKAVELGKSNLIKKVKRKTIVTANDESGDGSDILESEIEAYDRLKALELLAKYHDLINKTTVKMVDEAYQEIFKLWRTGRVSEEDIRAYLDDDLASEFFRQVNPLTVRVSPTEGDSE